MAWVPAAGLLPASLLRRSASFSTTATKLIAAPPSKAVIYDQHGAPDQVVRMADMAPVEIGERDVCVRMLAAPINPADINRIEGVYPVRPLLPAAVGGYEGVGQVHALGHAVTVPFSLGDWVIPSPPSFETWQTYVVKHESMWHKVRSDVPAEYAATVTANPLTALRMLNDFVKLFPGDAIVQNGATSIVGQCVIQLAKLRGIHTINIIRDRLGSDEAKYRLKQLGADEVFTEAQLDTKNLRSILRDLPAPALGFNCVGGHAASLILKFLRQGGTMVTYGGMSKKHVAVPTSSFIFKDLSLRGFWLRRWMSSGNVDDSRPMIDYLLALVHEGKLKYEMELCPFSEFSLALDKTVGKHGSQPKQVLMF